MEFDARERMDEIAEDMGGEPLLREQMRMAGYRDWETAMFYPVIAWFPQYMNEPDVLGIAVRNGFSFNVLFGCVNTPHQELNEWYSYVSLHDNYESVTEALLDHHKAFIATEVDMADAYASSWRELGEEVIAGIRPTKFNINDDDFLQDSFIFDIPAIEQSSLDLFQTLMDSLRNLGIGSEISIHGFTNSPDVEEIIVSQSSDFSEEFKDEWV